MFTRIPVLYLLCRGSFKAKNDKIHHISGQIYFFFFYSNYVGFFFFSVIMWDVVCITMEQLAECVGSIQQSFTV